MFKAQLLGVREMQRKIAAFQKRFPDKARQALREEAEIEMTEAKRRTPVDTGLLRSTGQVDEPTRSGKTLRVDLKFGTEYAVYVHENLEALHPVGQAKFLESTLNESAPFMLKRLADRMKFTPDLIKD